MATFLTAEWRDLVMLHYEMDAATLQPFVPRGTVLDLHEGHAYASVIGFRFLNTRVLGVPVPFHGAFEEVNLRFYVCRDAAAGTRHGVVFVREMVPRSAVALAARLTFNEAYQTAEMRHTLSVRGSRGEGELEYAWRRGGSWERLRARSSGNPAVPGEGSLGRFLTERHWGFTRQANGGTIEYRVDHPPWAVSGADDAVLDCDVATRFGDQFVSRLARLPTLAHVIRGSEIAISFPRRIA